MCRRDCLVEKSLHEILESFERSKTLPKQQQLQPQSTNSFAAKRTFESNSNTLGSFVPDFKIGSVPTEIPLPSSLKSIGEIKRVVFVDRVAMQWACGGIVIPSTLDTFHSPNRVMIICDGALVFYDFLSGATHLITPSDLNRVNISSAEFVYTDLCAIGGSDGSIRYSVIPLVHFFLVSPRAEFGIVCIGNLSKLSPQLHAEKSQPFVISYLGGPYFPLSISLLSS
jgi:hypothetical protein